MTNNQECLMNNHHTLYLLSTRSTTTSREGIRCLAMGDGRHGLTVKKQPGRGATGDLKQGIR